MSEKSNPYISDKKTSIKEKLRITLKGSDAKLSSQKTGKITEMDENQERTSPARKVNSTKYIEFGQFGATKGSAQISDLTIMKNNSSPSEDK